MAETEHSPDTLEDSASAEASVEPYVPAEAAVTQTLGEDLDADLEETKVIRRPHDPSFADTGRIRQFLGKTLLKGTHVEGAEIKKRGKAHELRYDFCVDPTVQHLKHVRRYSDIVLPHVMERIKKITMGILPIVIGQIIEKYKLKDGDLQIDEHGRITIPENRVVRIKRRRISFTSRTRRGKARSVLRLDEEIRQRYLVAARSALRNLAREIADDVGIPEELSAKLSRRFLILGRVQEGRNRSVFLARDFENEELVALKVRTFIDENVRDRHRNEVLALSHLNHDNITQYVDSEETEEAGYVALEWIDGVNLRQYMGKEGFLPLASQVEDGVIKKIGVMELALQTASAVHAGHTDSPGVIHRDLTPNNILVHNCGDVVVTDYGISAQKRGAGKLESLPTYTPACASPEQLNAESFDESTDVYSLGVVWYEATTGRLPHGDDGSCSYTSTESQVKIMVKRMRDAPITPPREIRPEVPEELEGLIMHCLKSDPASRPSMHQVLESLMAIYEAYFEKDVLGEELTQIETYTSQPAVVAA